MELNKSPVENKVDFSVTQNCCPQSPELKGSIRKRKKRKFAGTFKIDSKLVLPSSTDGPYLEGTKSSNSEFKFKNENSPKEELTSNIQSLIGEQGDLSWSSALQSPSSGSTVEYSNLNTEEKLTLVPLEFDNTLTSNDFVGLDTGTDEDSFFNSSTISLHNINKDGVLNQTEVGTEKICCRKLFFSPDRQKYVGKCENFLKNISCSCGDNEKEAVSNTEEHFSPILKQIENNLNEGDNGNDKHENEQWVKPNVIGESTKTDLSDCFPGKLNDGDSSTSNTFSACSTFFKEPVHEISFGVLEEICQASEILNSSFSQMSVSIIPISSKEAVKKLCMSSPVNEIVDKNIENCGSLIASNDCLKTKYMLEDKNEENSEKESCQEVLSKRNCFDIYSVMSKTVTLNGCCKPVQDILNHAKILEDAEKNRKISNVDEEKRKIILQELERNKGRGFLKFNSLNSFCDQEHTGFSESANSNNHTKLSNINLTSTSNENTCKGDLKPDNCFISGESCQKLNSSKNGLKRVGENFKCGPHFVNKVKNNNVNEDSDKNVSKKNRRKLKSSTKENSLQKTVSSVEQKENCLPNVAEDDFKISIYSTKKEIDQTGIQYKSNLIKGNDSLCQSESNNEMPDGQQEPNKHFSETLGVFDKKIEMDLKYKCDSEESDNLAITSMEKCNDINNAEMMMSSNSTNSKKNFSDLLINEGIVTESISESSNCNEFQGFSTASGRSIKVSDKAISKANLLFSDDLLLEQFTEFIVDKNIMSNLNRTSFKQNKALHSISSEKLQEKNLLNDNNFIVSSGFSSSCGKSEKVLNAALENVKNIFTEDSLIGKKQGFNENSVHLNSEFSENCTNVPEFSGFKTASGKTVNISKDAIENVKRLFLEESLLDKQEYCNEEVIYSKNKLTENDKDIPGCKGLLSVHEKSIDTSNENVMALCTENSMLNNQKHMNKNFVDYERELSANEIIIPGFSTASGKSVNISKDVLENAESLFTEENLLDRENEKIEITSCYKKELSREDKHVPGFSTASGKQVNVSKKALENAKRLFTEDNLLDKKKEMIEIAGCNKKELSREDKHVPGFSTASGKLVSVSEKALENAKRLFTEDNLWDKDKHLNDNVGCSEIELSEKRKSINIPGFSGFSTASGKSVNISKDALENAKRLFTEENLLDKEKEMIEIASYNKKELSRENKHVPGFSTASGKQVSVSKKALENAKRLFTEDNLWDKDKHLNDNVGCSEIELSEKRKSINIPGFSGFSTASGKSVNISKDALENAKRLFTEENLLDKEKEMIEIAGCNKKELSREDKHVPGFSTASGKLVSVSEKALENAKRLFTEDNLLDKDKHLNDNVGCSEIELSEKRKSINIPGFSGFSTASGKSVNISKDALENAKRLFTEENLLDKEKEMIEIASYNMKELSRENKHVPGFSTASGKCVIVSKDAIKNAKRLFEEEQFLDNVMQFNDVGSCSTKEVIGEDASVPEFSGFSIASGKLVNVSKESLENARLLFLKDNLLNQQQDFNKNHINSEIELCNDVLEFSGYSNAGGKLVNVSEGFIEEIKHNTLNKPPSQHFLSLSNNLNFKSNLSNDTSTNNIRDINLEEQIVPGVSKFPLSGCKVIIDLTTDKEEKKNVKDEDGVVLDKEMEVSQSYATNEENQANVSLSVVHEVSESAAAFMFDEDCNVSDVPSWVQLYVSSPSFLNDRSRINLSPIICNNDEITVQKKRELSPVLGSADRFKKRRRVNKCLKKFNFIGHESPIACRNNSIIESPNQNFRSPCQTSTPINVDKTKRKYNFNCEVMRHLPAAKRLKIDDDSMLLSQDDEKLLFALDIAEGRKKAAESQSDLIKAKVNECIKPIKGSLLQKKENGKRISLRDFVSDMLPQKYSDCELLKLGVRKSVIDVTSKNAIEFRFNAVDYFSADLCNKNIDGIPVGDGALVILDETGTAGVKEISRAFLASPNVSSSLISHKWVENHYRWIVWKLSAMERSFPTIFRNICLTLENVMLQLKYRYDREIDACQRPAIRKILETDDSSARRICVCVVDVDHAEKKNEIVVTDGWYSVPAIVDDEMVDLIRTKRKVVVGTKLVVHGAELINCDQGCDPLEIGPEVRLKLHTNSVRRARWNALLGFCSKPGPIRTRLYCIQPKGGLIGKLEAVVARCYPLVYKTKNTDGKNVLLSERAEEIESNNHQQKVQQLKETLYSQIQREDDSRRKSLKNRKCRNRMSNEEFQSILSPEKLIELTENSSDLQEILTKEQQDIVDNFRFQERERMHQLLQERLNEKIGEMKQRVSVPMFKVRLVDTLSNQKNNKWKSAILTIWKPPEDLQASLKEGTIIDIYNISASGCRNGELQLTAGRQMKFNVKSHSNEIQCRVATSLGCLNNGAEGILQFSEFDAVGVVIHISTCTTLQTVYISDAMENLLGISFWGSIKNYGWQSLIHRGSFLACLNLQWRKGTVSWRVPCSYVSEVTFFSLNPKQKHLEQAMSSLKDDLKSKDLEEFITKCCKKLFHLLQLKDSGGGGLSSVIHQEKSNECQQQKLKPNDISVNKTIDQEKAIIEQKKIMVQEKMKKLQCYGNPQPLSELPLLNSPLITKEFKAPFKNVSKIDGNT